MNKHAKETRDVSENFKKSLEQLKLNKKQDFEYRKKHVSPYMHNQKKKRYWRDFSQTGLVQITHFVASTLIIVLTLVLIASWVITYNNTTPVYMIPNPPEKQVSDNTAIQKTEEPVQEINSKISDESSKESSNTSIPTEPGSNMNLLDTNSTSSNLSIDSL